MRCSCVVMGLFLNKYLLSISISINILVNVDVKEIYIFFYLLITIFKQIVVLSAPSNIFLMQKPIVYN